MHLCALHSTPLLLRARAHDAEVPSVVSSGCGGRQTGGGGGRRENDKHEHGGSWGQLKIAQGRRGAKSDGETAGATVREAEARFIFSCFENEMFRSRSRGEAERKKEKKRKKKKSFTAECLFPYVKSNNGYFGNGCLLQK